MPRLFLSCSHEDLGGFQMGYSVGSACTSFVRLELAHPFRIKTPHSVGGWPILSHELPNPGLPHPSRAFCGRVGSGPGARHPFVLASARSGWPRERGFRCMGTLDGGLAHPFRNQVPHRGCPTLPALFAGGWALAQEHATHLFSPP